MEHDHEPNLGMHIANRLVEVGCTTCFAVPGDFNLLLLDQLLKKPELECVWCCNELNAGYAADGYARKKGIACVAVTFCVGGFSVINAIAGAYAEDLPVIIISGGPNSNDFAANHILHHTTGYSDYGQQVRAFREVTCKQVVIQYIEEAHRQIDEAISECLRLRKPVYIEVSCNIADLQHETFIRPPVPFSLQAKPSNQASLEAAVKAAADVLKNAVKPVLLAGPRIRSGNRRDMFQKLADKSKYAVSMLPDAKGMINEEYERFIGLYWGPASAPCVCETVEPADIVVSVGCVWTDYSTVGYSILLSQKKMITVEENRVTICGGMTFGCVNMGDFLSALADVVTENEAAFVNFQRMYVPLSVPPPQPETQQIRTVVLFKHIQEYIDSNTAIIAEVGDTWFNSQKLKLPVGCEYEMQMRYGSIGWSVGAVLGYVKACGADKRVLGIIGDGSFQMTAQEISTMIRYNLNPVIILINNGGYTIEVEIHDGPYNVIKNWDYTAFSRALRNDSGKLFTAKCHTEPDFVAALAEAKKLTDHICFIEVITHKDDCSKELLEWGSRVAACNGRRPNPKWRQM